MMDEFKKPVDREQKDRNYQLAGQLLVVVLMIALCVSIIATPFWSCLSRGC